MAVTKITRNGIVGFASALVQTTEANAGDNLLLNASDGNATNVNGSILSETDNAILVLKSHGIDFKDDSMHVESGSTLKIDSGAEVTLTGDGTIASGSTLTVASGGTIINKGTADGFGGGGGSNNVLINGGMKVCQRATSTAGVGNGDTGYVGPDQWYFDETGTTEGIFTISQEDNGGTNGQDTWMKVLCTTEEALGATTDMIQMMQRPEAQNCVQLLNGSAGIAETTVSADIIIHADGSSGLTFPVKVAFSVHTQDGTGRQCTGDVSIADNDTWERVSVIFPADSTATFDSNTGIGCTFSFSICGGSGRVASSLTWANDANDYITSATDNIADQANNYIGITNVQWEVGSVATDFAYEDIDTTVRKCWRYLQYFGPVAAGEFDIQGAFAWKAATADTVNSAYFVVNLDARARMRGTPTFATSGIGATNWKIYTGNRALDVVSVMTGGGLVNATVTGKVSLYMEATGTDFVVGSPVLLVSGTSGSTYYLFTAEL